MRPEAGGRVAGTLPAAQCVGRHCPDRRVVALQPLHGDTCGIVVEPHVRERFECRRAYLDAGVASPSAQDGPRPGGATDGESVDVVEAVFRVDVRHSSRNGSQSKPNALSAAPRRPRCRELSCSRTTTACSAAGSCWSVSASSAAALTSWCESSSAAMSLSGVVPGLHEPERAQRARAPPPHPAPQVTIGEVEHRHRLRDRAGPRDALRVAILDERFDQQPRDGEPMSRGTVPVARRRAVSSPVERTLYERAVTLREPAAQRLLYAERSPLHDDGSGHRERDHDRRPDHEGREARELDQQVGHLKPLHDHHGQPVEPRIVRPPLALPRGGHRRERRQAELQRGRDGVRAQVPNPIGGEIFEAFDAVRVRDGHVHPPPGAKRFAKQHGVITGGLAGGVERRPGVGVTRGESPALTRVPRQQR